MIISVRVSLRPRRRHKCEYCNRPITGPSLRLWGYAERGDRPTSVHYHISCRRNMVPDARIEAAIARIPPELLAQAEGGPANA